MCRVIDQIGIYKILKTSRGYTVINTTGEYGNHGHFKQLKTCYTIIKLMQKRTVPKSKYLRGSALRISTDKYYIDKVNRKIQKDKDRIHYFNPSKGVKNDIHSRAIQSQHKTRHNHKHIKSP